jgi:hypothetical protein
MGIGKFIHCWLRKIYIRKWYHLFCSEGKEFEKKVVDVGLISNKSE